MSKKLARILEVITSPATGEIFVTTIQNKISDAINHRIKNGILKQNVGYAIYNYGSGRGMNLESVHVESEFSKLPRKWL